MSSNLLLTGAWGHRGRWPHPVPDYISFTSLGSLTARDCLYSREYVPHIFPTSVPHKNTVHKWKETTKTCAWNIHRYGSFYSIHVILKLRLLVPLKMGRAREPCTKFFCKEENLVQSKGFAPIHLKLIYLTIDYTQSKVILYKTDWLDKNWEIKIHEETALSCRKWGLNLFNNRWGL